jgi:sigma54-dependent transcription regulator
MKENMENLKIANCRGLKPVLNDIAKAIKLLDTVYLEVNSCKPKINISQARKKLFDVISNEGYEFSNTGRLIKKEI